MVPHEKSNTLELFRYQLFMKHHKVNMKQLNFMVSLMRRWFMKRSQIQHENAWNFMFFSCIMGCYEKTCWFMKRVKTYLEKKNPNCHSGILLSTFAMVRSIMVCLWGRRSMYVSDEYSIWDRSSKQVSISLWNHRQRLVLFHILQQDLF